MSLTPEKQLFNENDDAKEKVATINAICNDTDCSNDCTVNDHTSVFEILGKLLIPLVALNTLTAIQIYLYKKARLKRIYRKLLNNLFV